MVCAFAGVADITAWADGAGVAGVAAGVATCVAAAGVAHSDREAVADNISENGDGE